MPLSHYEKIIPPSVVTHAIILWRNLCSFIHSRSSHALQHFPFIWVYSHVLTASTTTHPDNGWLTHLVCIHNSLRFFPLYPWRVTSLFLCGKFNRWINIILSFKEITLIFNRYYTILYFQLSYQHFTFTHTLYKETFSSLQGGFKNCLSLCHS